MQKTLTISSDLWIKLEVVHPDYDDGLFHLQDCVGGDVIIDRAEIPALIDALQKVEQESKFEPTS